jgi:hypothetical protein
VHRTSPHREVCGSLTYLLPSAPTSGYGGGSVAGQKRMRWYNPALGCFEWRDIPECDEEVFSLLEGYPGAKDDTAVYEEWRELGAGILTSLIRVGDTARDRREG